MNIYGLLFLQHVFSFLIPSCEADKNNMRKSGINKVERKCTSFSSTYLVKVGLGFGGAFWFPNFCLFVSGRGTCFISFQTFSSLARGRKNIYIRERLFRSGTRCTYLLYVSRGEQAPRAMDISLEDDILTAKKKKARTNVNYPWGKFHRRRRLYYWKTELRFSWHFDHAHDTREINSIIRV